MIAAVDQGHSQSSNDKVTEATSSAIQTNEKTQSFWEKVFSGFNLSMFCIERPKFNEECSICLETFLDEDLVLKRGCMHSFHQKCMVNNVNLHHNFRCPLCRAYSECVDTHKFKTGRFAAAFVTEDLESKNVLACLNV